MTHEGKNALRKNVKKAIKTDYFGKKANKTSRDWIAARYVDGLKDVHSIGNNGERCTFSPSRSYALRNAKIWDAYTTLASAGLVRMCWVPDVCYSMDDLKGDAYNAKANSDIRPSILEKQEKEFEETVEREGIWVRVGEFWNGSEWIHADSCAGFVGQDAHAYETDIMSSTVDACKEFYNSDVGSHVKKDFVAAFRRMN